MQELIANEQSRVPESERKILWDNRNLKMAKGIDERMQNHLLACLGVSHFFGKGNVIEHLINLGWDVSEFD